jgi:lipopolysaccharide biosynthesis glycosyltransferase
MYPIAERGVVVGCDDRQQWMLPWWWFHFSLYHSDLPVTFVDFGMSNSARKWCEQRGTLIACELPERMIALKQDIEPYLIQKWESIYTSFFWSERKAWFKKPLALLLSPYKYGLWLDLDCEVKGRLDKLFAVADNESGIALSRESNFAQKFYEEHNILLPGEISYNSGVIVFRCGSPIIQQWAELAINKNRQFLGDQQALCRVVFQHNPSFAEFSDLYNWNRRLGGNPSAVIIHWVGGWGKAQIRQQLDLLAHLSFLEKLAS